MKRRSARIVLHKHLLPAFREAAERADISLAHWLRKAVMQRIRGVYDDTEPVLFPQDGSPERHSFHLVLEDTLHDELRLVAMENEESMSSYMRKAGKLRIRLVQNKRWTPAHSTIVRLAIYGAATNRAMEGHIQQTQAAPLNRDAFEAAPCAPARKPSSRPRHRHRKP